MSKMILSLSDFLNRPSAGRFSLSAGLFLSFVCHFFPGSPLDYLSRADEEKLTGLSF